MRPVSFKAYIGLCCNKLITPSCALEVDHGQFPQHSTVVPSELALGQRSEDVYPVVTASVSDLPQAYTKNICADRLTIGRPLERMFKPYHTLKWQLYVLDLQAIPILGIRATATVASSTLRPPRHSVHRQSTTTAT